MILRLDPRRPIVWRTPTSLQIGVDPVLALLVNVSDGDAQLIAALAIGVTRSGLEMLASQAGVTLERLDELLAGVARALVAPAGTGTPLDARSKLVVIGRGVGAERVAAVLLEAGHPVTLAVTGDSLRARRPAAAVLVSGHVIDPLEHQRWLRRDVPHLPIVFGEVGATVGPLVMPGVSGCLACAEHHRTTADAAWPALAAQLWRTVASAESAGLATEAGVEALHMLRASIPVAKGVAAPPVGGAGEYGAASTYVTGALSVRLDSETGERTTRTWWPSEQCGCRELNVRSGLRSRRENGFVLALHAPTSHVAPTTTRASFVPG